MVLDMLCNFKKCRKPLTTVAWITSCSHAFCTEHGETEFSNKNFQDVLLCPRCNSQLTEKYDVVQADLNPSEAFKSIVLAGMKPDMIKDIALRAMAFWSYQLEGEMRYHENVTKHARERATSLEQYHNSNLQRLRVELQNDQKKIENLQAECFKQKRLAEEYAVGLEEKNREIQKLQCELGSQRRNSMPLFETDEVENERRQNVANIMANRFKPQESTSKFIFQPQMAKQQPYKKQKFVRNDKDFIFNPVFD